MTGIKHRRVEALSSTARFPATFEAILAALPERLRERLTAEDLAAVVDFGHRQSLHGYGKGIGETLGADAEAALVRDVERAPGIRAR